MAYCCIEGVKARARVWRIEGKGSGTRCSGALWAGMDGNQLNHGIVYWGSFGGGSGNASPDGEGRAGCCTARILDDDCGVFGELVKLIGRVNALLWLLAVLQ